MIVYTVMVMLITLAAQKLWKFGVSLVEPDRSQPMEEERREVRGGRDLGKEAEEKNEEEEGRKDEEALKDPFEGMSIEEKKRWREAEDRFLGITGDTDDQDHEDTKSEPVEEVEEKAQKQVSILKTRWGSVFHLTHSCAYLTNPTTGPAFESKWCEYCQRKWNQSGQGHFKKIKVEGLRGPFHTQNCPRISEAGTTQWLPICTKCEVETGSKGSLG